MRMRVLLAAERRDGAQTIEQALVQSRHEVVATVEPDDDLMLYVRRAQPDALVVEMAAPTRKLLAQLRRLDTEQPITTVVFAERSDSETLRVGIKSGVSAYVVDGLRSERVVPILETAMMRHLEIQALRSQRDEALARLGERKTVERAKGILMRRRDLREEAAYQALRKMAMDRGVRLSEVANSIITAEELLLSS